MVSCYPRRCSVPRKSSAAFSRFLVFKLFHVVFVLPGAIVSKLEFVKAKVLAVDPTYLLILGEGRGCC